MLATCWTCVLSTCCAIFEISTSCAWILGRQVIFMFFGSSTSDVPASSCCTCVLPECCAILGNHNLLHLNFGPPCGPPAVFFMVLSLSSSTVSASRWGCVVSDLRPDLRDLELRSLLEHLHLARHKRAKSRLSRQE